MTELTAKRLREIMDYNPKMGVFRWKEKLARRVYVGAVIGTNGPKNNRIVSIFSKRYQLHRLAFLWMTGKWPSQQVDHINCDRSDNRWNNLRLASPAQNAWNSQNIKGRKLPKGVGWDKQAHKYRARIRFNYEQKFLGHFNTAKEASAAYATAAKQLFGEYARSE